MTPSILGETADQKTMSTNTCMVKWQKLLLTIMENLNGLKVSDSSWHLMVQVSTIIDYHAPFD